MRCKFACGWMTQNMIWIKGNLWCNRLFIINGIVNCIRDCLYICTCFDQRWPWVQPIALGSKRGTPKFGYFAYTTRSQSECHQHGWWHSTSPGNCSRSQRYCQPGINFVGKHTGTKWYRYLFLLFDLLLFQLLKNKADINFVNEHGNTPLHYACFWGYSNIAEDLVNYGAYVSVANKYGEIPLDKCSGAVAKRLHGSLLFPHFGYSWWLFYFLN